MSGDLARGKGISNRNTYRKLAKTAETLRASQHVLSGNYECSIHSRLTVRVDHSDNARETLYLPDALQSSRAPELQRNAESHIY